MNQAFESKIKDLLNGAQPFINQPAQATAGRDGAAAAAGGGDGGQNGSTQGLHS